MKVPIMRKINPMPIKQTLNRDTGLRVMWKNFSEVGLGSPREGEILGCLSELKARFFLARMRQEHIKDAVTELGPLDSSYYRIKS